MFLHGTATSAICPLSLHDALPISSAGEWSVPTRRRWQRASEPASRCSTCRSIACATSPMCSPRMSICSIPTATTCSSSCAGRSEEHTSELQSHSDLVCRLLLEKKKKKSTNPSDIIAQVPLTRTRAAEVLYAVPPGRYPAAHDRPSASVQPDVRCLTSHAHVSLK